MTRDESRARGDAPLNVVVAGKAFRAGPLQNASSPKQSISHLGIFTSSVIVSGAVLVESDGRIVVTAGGLPRVTPTKK
jgi:hypothetical protein